MIEYLRIPAAIFIMIAYYMLITYILRWVANLIGEKLGIGRFVIGLFKRIFLSSESN